MGTVNAKRADRAVLQGATVSLALLAVTFATVLFSHATHSTVFDFRPPRIVVDAVYSDNIELAPSGEEESDFVTRVSMDTGANREGARAALRWNYRINIDIDDGTSSVGGSSPRVSHELAATGSLEVVENHAFIDARADVSPENIGSFGRVSSDTINRTDNITDVVTWAITPTLQSRFGPYAFGVATFDVDSFSSSGINSDSTSTGASVDITSGLFFPRTPWSVNFFTRAVDRDGGSNSNFRRVDARLRYLINSRYSVFGSIGYDDNDFESTSTTSGARWQIGGTWRPSRRTTVEAAFGEQFSGSNNAFDISHRRRRSVFTATYSEFVTTTRRQQIERELVPQVDEFGVPIIDLFSDPLVLDVNQVQFTDETQIRRLLAGTYALNGRRSLFTVRFFNQETSFAVTPGDQTNFGVSTNLTYDLSRRASASWYMSWSEAEFTDARQDERFSTDVVLRYRIARTLNGNVRYAYVQRESNEADSDFAENRISAGLSYQF